MASATAKIEQVELIDDDPRQDLAELSPLELIREYRSASKRHGGLITRPLAAEILGVTPAQIGAWCARERLTDVSLGPVKFVPGNEVEALYRERVEQGISKGGRGRKSMKMSDVVRLGSQLTEK